MGHSSSRAALMYLHSTDDRQRTLAEAVEQRAGLELSREPRGTRVARDGHIDDIENRAATSRSPPELGV